MTGPMVAGGHVPGNWPSGGFHRGVAAQHDQISQRDLLAIGATGVEFGLDGLKRR